MNVMYFSLPQLSGLRQIIKCLTSMFVFCFSLVSEFLCFFCSISPHHCRWDVGVHSMRRLQVKDYQNFCFLLCKFLFKVCYKHLMIQTVAQLLVCWLFSWLSVKWYIISTMFLDLTKSNYFQSLIFKRGWMKFSQIKLKTWLSSCVVGDLHAGLNHVTGAQSFWGPRPLHWCVIACHGLCLQMFFCSLPSPSPLW